MDTANKQIEQQITVLLRRVQRIHLSTTTGDVNLERSAYGIMCKLADEGPQRLGALATAFGLDPSTITRQVQALEEIGLAARTTDPSDRRASILDLTPNGREVLDSTRARRRSRLQEALADWPEADLTDFGRLLKEFNASLDRLLEESTPSTRADHVDPGLASAVDVRERLEPALEVPLRGRPPPSRSPPCGAAARWPRRAPSPRPAAPRGARRSPGPGSSTRAPGTSSRASRRPTG